MNRGRATNSVGRSHWSKSEIRDPKKIRSPKPKTALELTSTSSAVRISDFELRILCPRRLASLPRDDSHKLPGLLHIDRNLDALAAAVDRRVGGNPRLIERVT